jgi:adenine phosphoribosyltransferase
MMRKRGKMPNTVQTSEYNTEYGSRSGLCVQKDKILKGQRVLIVDDLVATGGTLGSAIGLVKMLGGTVVECACVVELKLFIDPTEESGLPSRTMLFEKLGHAEVPVWGLVSEDVLTLQAELDEDYVDDGEEH